MARKYNVAIKYEDGSTREYTSAQGLDRTAKICKQDNGAVWFRIEPEGDFDWGQYVREFNWNGSNWVRVV